VTEYRYCIHHPNALALRSQDIHVQYDLFYEIVVAILGFTECRDLLSEDREDFSLFSESKSC
jgi:hypothetical protein